MEPARLDLRPGSALCPGSAPALDCPRLARGSSGRTGAVLEGRQNGGRQRRQRAAMSLNESRWSSKKRTLQRFQLCQSSAMIRNLVHPGTREDPISLPNPRFSKGVSIFSQHCSPPANSLNLLLQFLSSYLLLQFLPECTETLKWHTHTFGDFFFFLVCVCSCLWTVSTFQAQLILLFLL